MNNQDVIILNQLSQGDEAAFREIFNRYWHRVFAAGLKYLSDHDDAKEVTQAIFQQLWERRSSIAVHTGISQYLLTAVKYKSLNFLRQKIRYEQHLSSYASLPTLNNATVEDIAAYRDTKAQIDRLVTAMPATRARIFKMSREQQLSNREISQRLKVSLKTVEYHISHALHFLRNKLNTDH